MLAMSNGLGVSLNPIKAVKSAARSTARAGRAVGRGTIKVAKKVGKIVVAPAAWLGTKLTAPLRSRVHKLRDRRAVKLAWDKRKSKQPTPAERAEAKAWTKSKLKSSGPHGHVLALFAGPTPSYFGSPVGLGIDPGTASVIAASLPVLIAVLNALLNKSAASGEAPADPGADAQAEAQAAAEVAALAAETPGAVDMTAMQDEMTAVAEDVLPPPPGMVRLPGIRKPIKQSHVLIGGIVLGGVLLVALLTRKRD